MNDLQKVIEHYDTGVENKRLLQGPPQVEGLRTRELLSRFLPSGKLRISDIGGGTGYYSFWLTEMGHEVHFLDASPINVDATQQRNQDSSRRLASIHSGDARKLPFADNFFDIVLMFGPL